MITYSMTTPSKILKHDALIFSVGQKDVYAKKYDILSKVKKRQLPESGNFSIFSDLSSGIVFVICDFGPLCLISSPI